MAGNQFNLFPNTEQPVKVCSRCRTRKHVGEFGLRYIGPRGPHYRSKCKPCERAYDAEWRSGNSTELNAKRRRLYKNNENYKGHARAWYQRNKSYFVEYRENPENRERMRLTERKRIASETPEQRKKRLLTHKVSNDKRREANRLYRQQTKERAQLLKKKWNETHPHARAEYSMRRRARKKGLATDNVDRAAIIARDKSTCYLCANPLTLKEIHLDHVIPLARGGPHCASNLRVACAPCNYAKGKYTLEEYLSLGL